MRVARWSCPGAETAPDLGSSYKYFGVPLNKVAVTQTVTNTFIELLGARDKMAVASEYTTSACIAKRVADGNAQAFVSNSADADGDDGDGASQVVSRSAAPCGHLALGARDGDALRRDAQRRRLAH